MNNQEIENAPDFSKLYAENDDEDNNNDNDKQKSDNTNNKIKPEKNFNNQNKDKLTKEELNFEDIIKDIISKS